mmetsp:Transcript_19970/g.55608  ORF Transcript_19970/g.55608 Transcript_19970/m.55608 type:complete len:413 (+) Transcript_19970:183-1421(+)|eukprot:CAMPEP_0202344574 /NCGR_PEP_ID=MMETSP1126-20121109/4196_1 /ASSEMBLY_ACC=CAM_ASM_000457 /TAXON_ID=3047 /ORGANISM="Dunaliella tertiolecta, Strain CCMP1320" /LENGTH=412 /DNA_ID=CAMNT_0048935781 /DNA_START=92 /DNA_END=1330 /DNA_ORIENTATION=+
MDLVLSNEGLLASHIFPTLSYKQAATAAQVCKQWRNVVRHMLFKGAPFNARLLLAMGSKQQIVDASCFLREFHVPGPISAVNLPTKKLDRLHTTFWLTSCTAADSDTFYCCQYRGRHKGSVIQFSGDFNETRSSGVREACRTESLQSPEGIAFVNGALFVLTAEATLVQLACIHADWHEVASVSLGDDVPWALRQGPDGALYATWDHPYETHSYVEPPGDALGCVKRIQLQLKDCPSDSMVDEAHHSISEFTNTPMRRPSGLCFGPCGSLFVTCMGDDMGGEGCVLGFAGPLHDQPGTLKLRVPVQPFGLIPWDVVAFPGANGTTTLVASVHRILDDGDLEQLRSPLASCEQRGEPVHYNPRNYHPALEQCLACFLCRIDGVDVLNSKIQGQSHFRRLPFAISHANMMYFCK